jgi:hypothetical protein
MGRRPTGVSSPTFGLLMCFRSWWAKIANGRSSSRPNERNLVLELGARGNSPLDENRVFLEDDKLEVAVKNVRWAMALLPAGRRQNRRQSNTMSRQFAAP